jgi:hypothetical protein
MTARDQLNRRMRLVGIVMSVAFALVLIGIAVSEFVGQQTFLFIFAPGFAMTVIASHALHFFLLRCPKCVGNLSPLLWWRGSLPIDLRVGYCPFCGVSLDEDLPSRQPHLIG